MHPKTSVDQQASPTRAPRHKWSVYWRLLRPHTLTASFVPVMIGTVFSLPFKHFHSDLFGAMLLASVLIQVAVNMFNEYYDYQRGLDHENSVGIAGAIVRDNVDPNKILTTAKYVLVSSLLLGLYLCVHSSWWLFPVGLCCIAAGYLYSGGPVPISATPMGELVAGVCMGLVIIVIAFFIQTGTVTIAIVNVSIPSSVLIGAILMANNIRDLDNDEKHGRKTLAILLKKNRATYGLAGMFIIAYVWIILLIAVGELSLWSLLSFASMPKAFQASRIFWHNTTPKSMMPGMVATAQTNTIFGLGLTLGLLFQYWYPQ